MRGEESPAIAGRIRALEERWGRPVMLRGVQHRNPLFRGRILRRPSGIIIEYHDSPAGYFWHYQTIEELLAHLEQGHIGAVFYEGDIQYTDASLLRPDTTKQPDE